MAFPENVRHFRELRGFSQEKLAETLGVTQQVISKYENGLSEPRLSEGGKLAEVLETTVEELLKISE